MTTTEIVPVIGLEVHAQLLTESKMFCGCNARYFSAPPNSQCCDVCAGMPGSLPVINARAVDYTIAAALALHCEIAQESKFDRKNYSYPDIPKGYQISQYDRPIGAGGWLDFASDGHRQRCGIIRVHLEEDTGKSLHTEVDGEPASLVDYNRSGVPLMEIVSAPDLASPEAAREYFAALRQLLMYLGINDGNLQEGSLRADVNVSLRSPDGVAGVKVEIKNLNSFRAVQRALEYELRRQHEVLTGGGTLVQETRGWLDREEATVSQRSKEYAHDYRYFPEPDLPPLRISRRQIDEIERTLPELPAERAERLVRDYAISGYQAGILTAERSLADFFEQTLREASGVPPRVVANWLTGDVARLWNEGGKTPETSPVGPGKLADLLRLLEGGTIGGPAAKRVLEVMFESDKLAEDIVDAEGLRQISDTAELERLVDAVLRENPRLIEIYRSGKTNVLQALIGKTMGASKGKADAAAVRALLEEKLSAP